MWVSLVPLDSTDLLTYCSLSESGAAHPNSALLLPFGSFQSSLPGLAGGSHRNLLHCFCLQETNLSARVIPQESFAQPIVGKHCSVNIFSLFFLVFSKMLRPTCWCQLRGMAGLSLWLLHCHWKHILWFSEWLLSAHKSNHIPALTGTEPWALLAPSASNYPLAHSHGKSFPLTLDMFAQNQSPYQIQTQL